MINFFSKNNQIFAAIFLNLLNLTKDKYDIINFNIFNLRILPRLANAKDHLSFIYIDSSFLKINYNDNLFFDEIIEWVFSDNI